MANWSNIAQWASGPVGSWNVRGRVRHNDATMSGRLPEAERIRHSDFQGGIHGAARWRKGVKHCASTARRRYERELVDAELDDYFFDTLKRSGSK